MTTTSEKNHDIADPSWVKLGFYATSIVFNLCLMAQVLTVGVAYFADPVWRTVCHQHDRGVKKVVLWQTWHSPSI